MKICKNENSKISFFLIQMVPKILTKVLDFHKFYELVQIKWNERTKRDLSNPVL